jgi:hypothetical protein
MIVSARLVDVFRRAEITGVDFLPVLFDGTSSHTGREWFQMQPNGSIADVASQTQIGIDPFDLDLAREYRCPLGDLLGLNLLSEVSACCEGTASEQTDLTVTRQYIGVRRGLLRPGRVLLANPVVWRLVTNEKLKGFQFEVAHRIEQCN